MQHFTPAKRRLVTALPVLLLLAIGLTTAGALRHYLFLRERVWESRTTLEAAESVRADLSQAHVANHEYLLSGGRDDLRAYRRAAGGAERALTLLAGRTANDVDLAAAVGRLATLARTELGALDRAAELRAAGDVAGATAVTLTAPHRVPEALVQRQVEEIERSISGRVQDDRAREGSATVLAYFILAMGVLAGGLVVLLLRWILLGYAEAQAAAVTEHMRARQEVDEHLAAERAARERVERLQALTSALARALTPEDVIEATTALAGVAVGCKACALMLLDEGGETFTLVPGAGYSAEAAAAWHTFPNVPGTTAEEAVRTGRPSYCRTRAEYAARGAHLAELARMLGLESLATMPLSIARQSGSARLLGALTFIFGAPRTFESEEAFLLAVAGQCALALDRAHLYVAERLERQHAEAALAERHAAEQALRESEERFRTLAENIPQLAWMTDASGRAIWRNSRMYRYTGMTPDADAGTFTPSVHHPDHYERVRDGFLRAIEAGEAWEDTFPLRGADGEFRWFLSRAVPISDDAGRIIRWFGTNTDVTAQREAEAALRESEERFRTLADNIPQLAWMADATGWLFWYNRRWYEYTGTTLEEMEGWGWRAVHHPDHVQRVVERIQHSWDTGELWEDTFPLRSRTGEYRWFLSRAFPIRNSAGEVVRWFGTSTDITDQLQAEAALRLAKEEAEHANRGKSEFLAAMSHELRTPLNAIGGYVELLELGIHGPVTELQRASLVRIRVNGQHLLALINDILSYAKLEAGRITYEIRELNVLETLEGVEPLVAPQIQKKGLTYASGPCDPSWAVMGDHERVRQILLNLIGNATKFTDPGGRVEVSCTADEQRVHLRVRDTGHGIEEGRLERIFEPFVQLERHRVESSQQGVGLGLAISRELARGMDGEISVESVQGSGSTFTLILPRAERGVDARLAAGERRRGGDRRGGTGEERRSK